MKTEYLALYFPFKLKIKQRPFSEIETLRTHHLDEQWIKDIIPILRPISDLRKDEFFDLYMDFCESLGMVNCVFLLDALEKGTYYAIDIKKYQIIEEFMCKNHFDWKYNLIEKGLAIDINTLN